MSVDVVCRAVSMSEAGDTDRGWAWMVLIGSTGSNIVVGGLSYTAGLMTVPFIETFGYSLSQAAWLGSLFSSTMCLAGVLASMLTKKTSCRTSCMMGGFLMAVSFGSCFFVQEFKYIFLLYGLFAGSSGAFILVPTFVVLGYNFKKYLNLVSGIMSSGASIGIVTVALLIRYSLDNYGLRGTFLILSGIGFNSCFFGSLYRPSRLEKQNCRWKQSADSEGKCSHRVHTLLLLRDVPFLNICASILMWSFAIVTVFVLLPVYVMEKGGSKAEAIFLVFLIGLVNTFTRFLVGFAANDPRTDKFIIYFSSLGLAGISSLLFPMYSGSHTGQIVFALAFGTYLAPTYTLLNSISIELLGVAKLDTAFGIEMTIVGIGSLLGPPLAGFLSENSDSLDNSFIFAGSAFLLSSFHGLMASVTQRRQSIRSAETGSIKETEQSFL